MAQWKIVRKPNGKLSLVYRNVFTESEFDCGECAADMDPNLIAEWVVRYGQPGPKDVIVTENGEEIRILPLRVVA